MKKEMQTRNETLKESLYYEKLSDSGVRCTLCPHYCGIKPGKTGICGVRKNIDGTLYSINYGRIASASLDPIEKKPLNRFFPGSYVFSVGTYGCNFKCPFCQNWEISQEVPETAATSPDMVAKTALALENKGNIGVAYTYNEPIVWYEFVYDTCLAAHERDLKNILVTNGYINPEPLKKIMPYISAMNIDVKAFTEEFYVKICKAKLEPVKKTVEYAASRCHVEITTLVIPGLNDSVEEIGKLSKWLSTVSPKIPLHLSRFFPAFKMTDKKPTPTETLAKLQKAAKENLEYVFLGNV